MLSCRCTYVPYTVTKPHARAGDVTQNDWFRHSSRIASPRKGYTKWLGLPFKSHSLSAYRSSSAFYCDKTTCTSRRCYKMIGSASQSIKSPYSLVRVLFIATEPRHENGHVVPPTCLLLWPSRMHLKAIQQKPSSRKAVPTRGNHFAGHLKLYHGSNLHCLAGERFDLSFL